MDVHPDLNLLQNQRWHDPPKCPRNDENHTNLNPGCSWLIHERGPFKTKNLRSQIPCLALQNTFCWFDIPPLSHYLHGIPTNCHYPKYTMTGANPRCLAPIEDNPTHFWWNTHFWCYPYPCLVRNELQRLAFFHSMKASISATAAGLSLRPKIWVAQRGGNVEWGIGS